MRIMVFQLPDTLVSRSSQRLLARMGELLGKLSAHILGERMKFFNER